MGENIAKLILRITVGGMLLFHGIHKAVHGIGFIKGMLKSHGIPEMLAYGVYVGEILAPLFLIIGWRSRVWAAVIALNMAGALYLAHSDGFLKLGTHGAWAVELPMFYLLSAVAIVLQGSGKYAVIRD